MMKEANVLIFRKFKTEKVKILIDRLQAMGLKCTIPKATFYI